ncbi:MAG: alanine--glyoxylate aminotransferase family protein [Bacteriovoracaceae bacterium]|jgi:alanine-glyoxylate transaminase / serine-glyoxylate transaminase / serine-pyruvate transaminase|nr:alanine--glyoxylate aminotransferase family protein [Bacteriovoracaceae bacterium]
MNRFYPPTRVLMGPGPSDIHPRVLQAMSMPTIGHLDPVFVDLMEEVKSQLKKVFVTDNKLTFPVSAPGSAGMETCFVNLVEPGDKVIVCQNGVFGMRMEENVIRCGGTPIIVKDDWGRAVDVQKVEQAMANHPDASCLAFVHAETSTGALSDAKKLCQLADKNQMISIVDTVTSLAGVPVLVDEWGMDAVYSGTQKCMSCVPGLSPVTFSDKATSKIKNRKSKVQSWFLDLNLVMNYWNSDGKRSYHHTAPVNSIYALHESLCLLLEEGLEASWKRHSDMHQLLKTGLESRGIEFIVPENERLPQLNAVKIPSGVDDGKFRGELLQRYGIEIGAGLGPFAGTIWRIGLMGQSAGIKNVNTLLSAFTDLGVK